MKKFNFKLLIILRLFLSPQQTFVLLGRNPQWLTAFILYCSTIILVFLLTIPKLVNITISLSEKNFSFSIINLLLNKWIASSLLIIPIIELIKILILSYLCLGLCLSFNIFTLTNKKILSIICHARLIFAFEALFNALIILSLSTNKLIIQQDLNFNFTGFNTFFNIDQIGKFAFQILSNISIFSIWYVAVLSIALKTITDSTKLSSIIISTILYTIELSFIMAFYYILGS